MMKRTLLLVLLTAGIFTACNKEDDFLPFADQLKLDKAAIDKFLLTHAIDAVKDSSGLRYVVHTVGTGTKPTDESRVYIRQIVKDLNGTVIAADTAGNYYTLGSLLDGQKIALKLMTKGSYYTLYVPSGLGYGNNSISGFGSNVNLVFEMKLLDDDAQLAADLAYIDAYLDTVDNVIEDPSGLRLVIVNPGTMPHPNTANTVVFDYTGKYLKTGATIASATNITQPLVNLIDGFKYGLPYIGVGGRVKLYMPSKLGYGYTGSPPQYTPVIPGNSLLYYDVALNAF